MTKLFIWLKKSFQINNVLYSSGDSGAYRARINQI